MEENNQQTWKHLGITWNFPDLLNWGDKRWKIIWKKFSNFTNFKCLNAWVVNTWKQSTSRWFSVRRNVQAQNEARNVNLRILRFIFVQTLLYTLTSLFLVHGCHLQQEWIVGYLDLETGKVKWNTIKALKFHVCNSRKQQKLEIELAVFYFQGGHLPQNIWAVVCNPNLEIVRYWRYPNKQWHVFFMSITLNFRIHRMSKRIMISYDSPSTSINPGMFGSTFNFGSEVRWFSQSVTTRWRIKMLLPSLRPC